MHALLQRELTTWLKSLSMSCLPPCDPAVPTEKKLEEFSVEEAEVLQILTQVNVVRRECEIVSVGEGAGPRGPGCFLQDGDPQNGLSLPPQKLEAANFDEKKEINKRKQMILEGKVRAEPVVEWAWGTSFPVDDQLSHLPVLPMPGSRPGGQAQGRAGQNQAEEPALQGESGAGTAAAEGQWGWPQGVSIQGPA